MPSESTKSRGLGQTEPVLSIDVGYEVLRSGGPGWVALDRDVVVVQGRDALTYLDGQMSQELAGLKEGESVYSLLLQPSGKLGWWLRVNREDEDVYVFDVDPGAGEAVAARLDRFKLRVDATVTVSTEWSFEAERRGNEAADPPFGVAPALWPGAAGYDTWGRRRDADEADGDRDRDGPRIPPEALEAIRIEAGVPRTGAEITDEVIPAELGQWLIDASVSFTKGCYTGQELVARIDSRGGNVPRHLRGLVLDDGPVPPPGSGVVVDGELVGSVTSSTYSPGLAAPIALAFIRRKVEPPSPAVVTIGDEPRPAQIRRLPLVGGREQTHD
jgi:tRNA-modifying protein YgfZ